MFSVAVQQQDFDVGQEYQALIQNDLQAGAVVFFVGRVRDLNLGESVAGLTLEHYPGMTEKALQDIIAAASERWQLQAARIVHRVGYLGLGEQIVFVAATSVHREQAFAAAEFMMDFLKTRAPFWKREERKVGSLWLEAKTSDAERAKRW